MSFVEQSVHGTVYAPGWFLNNNEACTRKTYQFGPESWGVKTAENGGKYVAMGSIYKDDGNAIGIVYEDVDVSSGDMPGSVVTKGEVYQDRLPMELESADKTALEKLGFVFTTSPEFTKPY